MRLRTAGFISTLLCGIAFYGILATYGVNLVSSHDAYGANYIAFKVLEASNIYMYGLTKRLSIHHLHHTEYSINGLSIYTLGFSNKSDATKEDKVLA